MGNRALHDPERSLEIDIKNGFNGAGGDFMQRCETVADPGIIAQNVDAAVTGKGRSEHRIDLLDIGNIHATGLCQPANVSGNLLFGTSELQSLMRISYAVFCLKKNTITRHEQHTSQLQ